MMTLVAENLCLTDGHRARPANAGSRQTYQNVRRWHRAWVKGKPDGETAVAAESLLKIRARKLKCHRQRAAGGGRQCKAAHCREALYECFSSIRYAVDWKAVIADNRSRGLKKNLARFPRAFLRVKLTQLLREHAHACLLNVAVQDRLDTLEGRLGDELAMEANSREADVCELEAFISCETLTRDGHHGIVRKSWLVK